MTPEQKLLVILTTIGRKTFVRQEITDIHAIICPDNPTRPTLANLKRKGWVAELQNQEEVPVQERIWMMV